MSSIFFRVVAVKRRNGTKKKVLKSFFSLSLSLSPPNNKSRSPTPTSAPSARRPGCTPCARTATSSCPRTSRRATGQREEVGLGFAFYT